MIDGICYFINTEIRASYYQTIRLESTSSQIYSVTPPESPLIQVHYLRSNLSNTDTEGTERSVHIREVSV